jgi:tRNA(fMet)-specific endonuclease VapC
MKKVILDNDTLSEILRGRNPKVMEKAHNYFDEFEKFTISAVTVYEIFQGIYWDYEAHKKKEEKFFVMLPDLEVIPLCLESGILAGKINGELLKTGLPIGRCDPLIAGIAIHNNLTLATGNTEHYQRVRALGYPLTLENWKE